MTKPLPELVAKSPFKSLDKVIAYVNGKQKKAGVNLSTKAEIQAVLNGGKKAKQGEFVDEKVVKHYYRPIFANHHHQYQIDLLQQSRDGETDKDYPPFFFMAINTNTKFAFAFPIKGKSTEAVLGALKKLWEATGEELRTLVSDEEKALESAEVTRWLEKNEIGIKFVSDQNHTALGIVDRLIRTLRDMNKPNESSKQTSEHRKFRDFTDKRMQKFLKAYNSAPHGTTKMKPKKMQKDKKAETKYIIRKLYESEARKKISDFDLKPGTWVRYILPRDPMKKNRHKVSPEKYQVKAKNGNAWLIAGADGSTKTVARWRLLPITEDAPTKVAKGFTHDGTKRGHNVVKKIKDYDPKTKKFLVEWNDDTGDSWETIANVRADRNDKSKETNWEAKFWTSARGKEIRGKGHSMKTR